MRELMLFHENTPAEVNPTTVGMFYGGWVVSANVDRRNADGARINLVSNVGTARHSSAGAVLDNNNAMFFGGGDVNNQVLSIRTVMTSDAVLVIDSAIGLTGRRNHAMADVEQGAISYAGGLLNGTYTNEAISFNHSGTSVSNIFLGGATTYLGGCSINKVDALFYGGVGAANIMNKMNYATTVGYTRRTITSDTVAGTQGAAVGSTGIFGGYITSSTRRLVRVNESGELLNMGTFAGTLRQQMTAAAIGAHVVFHGGFDVNNNNTLYTTVVNESGTQVGSEITSPIRIYAIAGVGV